MADDKQALARLKKLADEDFLLPTVIIDDKEIIKGFDKKRLQKWLKVNF